jgi:ABC-2 type transport system permease protein
VAEASAASARAGGVTRPAAAARDTLTLTGRSLRLTRRNLDSLVSGLVLPVFLMLLFVYLLGGAIHTGMAYVTYVVPGVVLLCAGFVAAQTAMTVQHDMAGGTMDRFRSMDVSGAALLAGHVIASVARDAAATALVLAVAFLIGFRAAASPPAWLAATAILVLYMNAVSWLAAAIGLLTRSAEAAGNVTFAMMFLPYLSSAFVPIPTMPSWIQGFAAHEPITPVIDSFRGLLLRTATGDSPWLAAGWCIGIALASIALAAMFFRRRDR